MLCMIVEHLRDGDPRPCVRDNVPVWRYSRVMPGLLRVKNQRYICLRLAFGSLAP